MLSKEEQTACEIVCRRQENFLRLEKEKHLKNKIQQLEADNYEQNNIINSYIEREQKLIEKLEEKNRNINKLLDEMMTDMGKGIKIINVTGLTRKEKEEVVNKRDCLLVQEYCYEEILKILKGER